MTSSIEAQKAAPTRPPCAAYVAGLLQLDPYWVFPDGIPKCPAEADRILVEAVLAKLAELTQQAERSPDRSYRALWFRKTLCYCNRVMSGKVNPADNGWSDNGLFHNEQYRRGIYFLRGGDA